MNELFGFLYARPSFVEGVARVLDFGDTLTEYNQSLSPQQANSIALRADWEVVRGDVRAAMTQFAQQLEVMREDAKAK